MTVIDIEVCNVPEEWKTMCGLTWTIARKEGVRTTIKRNDVSCSILVEPNEKRAGYVNILFLPAFNLPNYCNLRDSFERFLWEEMPDERSVMMNIDYKDGETRLIIEARNDVAAIEKAIREYAPFICDEFVPQAMREVKRAIAAARD